MLCAQEDEGEKPSVRGGCSGPGRSATMANPAPLPFPSFKMDLGHITEKVDLFKENAREELRAVKLSWSSVRSVKREQGQGGTHQVGSQWRRQGFGLVLTIP